MNIKLKKQIMRRIYTVWVLRTLSQPALLKIYTLAVFILFSSRYVSIKDVSSNFLTVYKTSFSSFMYSAFANTEIITLMLMIGMVFILSWLMKDFLFTQKNHLAV